MNRCLLCLEINIHSGCSIKINSTEWHNLNIESIIEKHLWSMKTLNSSSHICKTCWQELNDFHNFFKSIQNAHQNLSIIIKYEPNSDDYSEKYLTESNTINNCPVVPEVFMIKDENSIDIFEKEDTEEVKPLQQRPKLKYKAKKTMQFRRNISLSKKRKRETDKQTVTNSRSKRKRTVCDIQNQNENIEKIQEQKVIKIESNNDNFTEKSKLTENNTIVNCKNELENLLIKQEDSIDIFEEENVQMIDNQKQYDMKIIKKQKHSNDTDNNNSDEESSHNDNKPGMKTLEYDKFISEHHQLTCCLCQIPLATFTLMIKHFKELHKQRGYVVCCKRKFSYRTELIDHINVHLNPEYFKCNECNKIFANRSCLRIHVKKIHEGNTEKNFDCDICGKTLVDKYRLKFHKLIHEAENQERLPCKECDKTFRNSFSLSSHIRTVHLKKYSKICDLCGISIADKEKFKHHMLEHEGKPVPMLTCDICGRRLADKKCLRRHMNSHHPSEEDKHEFNCQICMKTFASLANVKKHIKDVHNNNYDYKCTMCIKAFKRPDALRDHIARHTGTPIHACGWCSKTFYSNGQMYAHRKSAHPKEWQESVREKFSGNLPDKYKISTIK